MRDQQWAIRIGRTEDVAERPANALPRIAGGNRVTVAADDAQFRVGRPADAGKRLGHDLLPLGVTKSRNLAAIGHVAILQDPQLACSGSAAV